MSIQFENSLIDGSWKVAKPTAAIRNDQQDSNETLGDIVQGSLNLRDLAYTGLNYMRAVIKKKAWFINRLGKPLIFYLDGKPFTWAGFEQQDKKNNAMYYDLEVLLGQKNPVRCRMVVRRAPKAIARQRIEKTIQDGKRNKNGYKPSKEHIIKCHYDIRVTNLSKEQMPAKQVFEAYRLRWQVECCFKAWKSILEIDQTKPVKTPRMACQMLAKLIKALLFDKVLDVTNGFIKQFWKDKGCSRHKLFRLLELSLSHFAEMVARKGKLFEWIKTFLVYQVPDLIVESRLAKPTHYEILHKLLKTKEQ